MSITHTKTESLPQCPLDVAERKIHETEIFNAINRQFSFPTVSQDAEHSPKFP